MKQRPNIMIGAFTAILTSAICGTAAAETAGEILNGSGVKGGLVVHLGCGDGKLTAGLRVNEKYLVHGLDADPGNVESARKYIQTLGIYGHVSVAAFDGTRLPYADNLVNLIVVEDVGKVSKDEITRVLAPLGVAHVRQNSKWTTTVKPWPKEIDEWTHFLHAPNNNAVAQDAVIGEPRSLQWVGGPRWGRSHEEMASMSACVSAKGRVFYIVDEAPLASIRYPCQWKLVARDAFSGVILWKRDVGLWNDHLRHFRSGPTHLPRRLVAVGDEVYATLGFGEPVSALDAATGKTLRTYGGTEFTEEILCDDGVLYLVVGSSEVNRRGEGLFQRGEPKPTSFRYIAAMDAASGNWLWKKETPDSEFIMPTTLGVNEGNVFLQTTGGLECLDATTGKRIWKTGRKTPLRRMAFSSPTLVIDDNVVLLADRILEPGKNAQPPAAEKIEWGVHGWNISDIPRKAKTVLTAYAADTGEELWSSSASEGYNSAVDVFVVDGLVWVGPRFPTGLDLKTGEVKRTLDVTADPVGMVHARCYRNKATSRFVFTCRSGVEVIDLEKGWIGNNSWVRGTCQYGIMPSNGFVYVPPNACGCFNKVKLQGFNALAANRHVEKPDTVLEKGPAYGQVEKQGSQRSAQWPMYRHDAERSGAVETEIPDALKTAWQAKIGGKLTQPVVAGGKVLVASEDAHAVHALDEADGKPLWSYTTGGRIDSPPTLFKGLALFGSHDGWVYCLRVSDGELVWRFRAAPAERLIGAFGQLESAWPVHGSVLVQDDTAYVTAGRNSYVDGGLRFYGLNPATGEKRFETSLYHLDSDTGRQTGKEGKNNYHQGFDMEGTLNDLLTGDGHSVFLKHHRFDSSGEELAETVPHLFTPTGFLGKDWYVRTYWLYGTDTGAGYGGWARMKSTQRSIPAGRILCLNERRVFGYGRVTHAGGKVGHRADAYHLFAMEKNGPPVEQTRRRKKKDEPQGKFVWSQPNTMTVRAMVLADGRLILAGVPDAGGKSADVLEFTNPDEAIAAFRGDKGSSLRILNAADGSQQAEYDLPAPPVFDGMAAADNRLFVSLKNGAVICLKRK